LFNLNFGHSNFIHYLKIRQRFELCKWFFGEKVKKK
jgi:hypothetical protein